MVNEVEPSGDADEIDSPVAIHVRGDDVVQRTRKIGPRERGALIEVDAQVAAEIHQRQVAPSIAVEIGAGDLRRRHAVGSCQHHRGAERQRASAEVDVQHGDTGTIRHDQVAVSVAVHVGGVRPVAQLPHRVDAIDDSRRVERAIAVAAEDLERAASQDHDVHEAIRVEIGDGQRHRPMVHRHRRVERAVPASERDDDVAVVERADGSRAGDQIADAVFIHVRRPHVEIEVGMPRDVEGGTSRRRLRGQVGHSEPGHYQHHDRLTNQFRTRPGNSWFCLRGDEARRIKEKGLTGTVVPRRSMPESCRKG